jgi:hypothetical protein
VDKSNAQLTVGSIMYTLYHYRLGGRRQSTSCQMRDFFWVEKGTRSENVKVARFSQVV